MTYSFSNSDLVAKHWLTCLFKAKKGSENGEIHPPPPPPPPLMFAVIKNFPQKLHREALSMLIYDKLCF